jgi:hypothetical protein
VIAETAQNLSKFIFAVKKRFSLPEIGLFKIVQSYADIGLKIAKAEV